MKSRICKNDNCNAEYMPTGRNQRFCSVCSKLNEKQYNKNYDKRAYAKFGKSKKCSKYQITEEQFNKMFEEQEGCCAICRKHQTQFDRSLAIDHCHQTTTVRGLLCTKCNLMLGYAEDNIGILAAAIKYLTK